MHSRDLVELAALVAVHGPVVIRRGRISESALEQYWVAAKARQEGWSKSLKAYLDTQPACVGFTASEASLVCAWRTIRPVIEEILTSEVLTRVWTAVASAYDRQRGSRGIELVLQSVFIGHLEARNRALNVLVYGRGITIQEAVEVNRLRRRNERWCDMLLGYIICDQPLDEFAFEPQRTRDFARDMLEELNRPLSPLGWQLVLSSLRNAFQQGPASDSPSAALNQQIASAILSCFQSELFDSTGLLRSLWMERINHTTADTEGMIEELLAIDDGALSRSGLGTRH